MRALPSGSAKNAKNVAAASRSRVGIPTKSTARTNSDVVLILAPLGWRNRRCWHSPRGREAEDQLGCLDRDVQLRRVADAGQLDPLGLRQRLLIPDSRCWPRQEPV